MNTAEIQINLQQVKAEIQQAITECSQRGLLQTVKWLSELNFSLKHIKLDTVMSSENSIEAEDYLLAKSYFNCQEYERAAFFSENGSSPQCKFIHVYSQYLAMEKKRLDNLTESIGSVDFSKSKGLKILFCSLKQSCFKGELDGYGLYLYGVVLKKLELRKQAMEVLEEAVALVPHLWSAWMELSTLPEDREELDALNLPSHWMSYFFLGQCYLELKLTDQALDIFTVLQNHGFEKFVYVIAQIGVAHHDRRDVNDAIASFRTLQQQDPFRLDNLDIYSHLLYISDMRTELANLAHQTLEIDKYREETCCVIGNYYSLRNEHQKAVIYFQRALKLNPQYLSAWILMGHEFVELQNSNAAIHCYRQAIDVKKNEYRAWNGLGQAYEILGLNGYCIYYYSMAALYCPSDSRMLVALGEAFEKLDKIPLAVRAYNRAHSVGDIEGMALLKLAKLYDKLSMVDSAAAAYSAACIDTDGVNKGFPVAYKYLANYHLNHNALDHAAHYAYKCLDYDETKEEGKVLLKTISERRISLPEAPAFNPEKASILEQSDTPATSRPSCAITLNYSSLTPSSGDNSKFNL